MTSKLEAIVDSTWFVCDYQKWWVWGDIQIV